MTKELSIHFTSYIYMKYIVCVYIYIYIYIYIICAHTHIYIHHVFFIHASVNGHLGYFHILVIVNSTAMNIGLGGGCIFSKQ